MHFEASSANDKSSDPTAGTSSFKACLLKEGKENDGVIPSDWCSRKSSVDKLQIHAHQQMTQLALDNRLSVLFCLARALTCASRVVQAQAFAEATGTLNRLVGSRNARASTAESQNICDGVPTKIYVRVQTKTGLHVCPPMTTDEFRNHNLSKGLHLSTKDNFTSMSEVQTKSGLHVVSANDSLMNFEITTAVERERRSE